MRKIQFVLLLAILATARTTEAQVRLLGETSRKGESVSAILLRAGCNPMWLSKALSDSGIDPSHRNNLRAGTRVILKQDFCEPNPPAEIALRSKALMAPRPTNRKRVSAEPTQKREAAPQPQNTSSTPVESAQKSEANPSINEHQPYPERARLVVVGLLSALGGGALASLFFWQRGRKLPARDRMSSSVSASLREPPKT